MARSLPLQIAVILAAAALLYFVSPLDPEPTLFVVVPICGALMGMVISKRPKTGAAIGFLAPLLIWWLLAAFVVWMLLTATLPT
jgi:hypothetical protein